MSRRLALPGGGRALDPGGRSYRSHVLLGFGKMVNTSVWEIMNQTLWWISFDSTGGDGYAQALSAFMPFHREDPLIMSATLYERMTCRIRFCLTAALSPR